MRGDMEILAYNLVQWTGGELPWEKNKLLGVPAKVQQAKEELMSNVGGRLKDCYVDHKSPGKGSCRSIKNYSLRFFVDKTLKVKMEFSCNWDFLL